MKKINTAIIPYLAGAFQALQFAHAAYVYFGWFGAFIGLFAGVVINLSVAVAASRIDTTAKGRRPLAWLGLGALMVLSPVMVAPAAFASMAGVEIVSLRWIVASVWALAPDASMLLAGAIAGKGMAVDGNPSATPAQLSATTPRKKRKLTINHIDRAKLAAQLRINPGATPTQIAEMFHVSRQAASAAMKKVAPTLTPKGK